MNELIASRIPANLRLGDLVAKTARVTLKDTLRVIAALDAISYLYNSEPTDIVAQLVYNPERPEPTNVAACEQEFFALRDRKQPNAFAIQARLQLIRDLT